MDRRRAAGALLALAACIATSAAAPTAGNNTALDLYDEHSEGCYYNFQHYGEGDRIMTNEPCLNCTCHNRMLMCYLRVCPFTKAIGQDCTVEKRADQCCPIVTCPDVPVDLLTSTSTSSPAEYGGTGLGKVDNYGCSINGKYFPEGAKVPPTPNKPCEHCYCIRNMTTCVMQECTLHVDGCTPIYHKDVCCPVRYFCDHPEDEMPALDDMTTTVRPTPGFLLTTTPPTEEPTTLPAKRDCIEDDQLYSDGALIKREKPCEHCYCMKGDIVCVVQECGTPMENEGKNCTSLPPREGQCCPDTYICEGDELSTEPSTNAPLAEVTTLVPPRRVSVEGSGYRNDDELPYTEVPTFMPDIEGSGEEDFTQTPVDSNKLEPEKETTEKVLDDRFATEDGEFIPKTTQASLTETPEVPPKVIENEETTRKDDIEVTEKPPAEEQETTSKYDATTTEPTFIAESTKPSADTEVKESSSTGETASEPSSSEAPSKSDQDAITETPNIETIKTTVQPSDQELVKETSEPPVATTQGVENETVKLEDSRRTSPVLVMETTKSSVNTGDDATAHTEGTTEIPGFEETTPKPSDIDIETDQNTVPVETEEATQPSKVDKLSTDEELELPSSTITPLTSDEISSISYDRTTTSSMEQTEDLTVQSEEELAHKTESSTPVSKEDEYIATTVPAFRKEDEATTSAEIATHKESEEESPSTEAVVTPSYEEPTTEKSTSHVQELDATTIPVHSGFDEITAPKETTTESLIELSTFAHEIEKETVTSQENVISQGETTTVNPEDNEIEEVPSPGRIPGEGDCLLDGVTFKNDSMVPSNNKCYSDCKCISSIIKCDPIICSPPPEYMDNCQPRYDAPDSCCPTYICDHGKETIPPESHSHMAGTESPVPSPSIDCNGDQCEVTDKESQPTVPPKTPERVGSEDCESESCKSAPQIPVQTYPEGCTGSQCTLPAESCTNGECEMSSQPVDRIGPTEASKPCASAEGCGDVSVPVHCEGDSCLPEIKTPQEISQECQDEESCKNDVPEISSTSCDGVQCDQKPENIPSKDSISDNIPQPCENEDDCKQSQVPDSVIPVSLESETNQPDKICLEENGCKTPDEATGEEHIDKTEFTCTSTECLHQKPITPTDTVASSETLSTDEPISQEQSTPQTLEHVDETLTTLPELPASLPETIFETTTTGESKISITDDRFTTTPVPGTVSVEYSSATTKETATTSSGISDSSPQQDNESELDEKLTGKPELDISTETPKDTFDEEPESTTKSADITKSPEESSTDQEQTTVSSVLSTVSDKEKLPEQEPETDEKITELPSQVTEKDSELPKATTEQVISVTEPHKVETETKEIAATDTQITTESPVKLDDETSTSDYEIDQTASIQDVTETNRPVLEEDESTNLIPDRSGGEEEPELHTGMPPISEVTETSINDTEMKEPVPTEISESDLMVIQTTSVPFEETDTESPEETGTKSPEETITSQEPERTEQETETKAPEEVIPDLETETQSPADLVPSLESETEIPDKIVPETETKGPEEAIPEHETETQSPTETVPSQESETEIPDKTAPETETKAPEELIPEQETETQSPTETVPSQESETEIPDKMVPGTETRTPEEVIPEVETETQSPIETVPPQESETETPDKTVPETETKTPEDAIPEQETETQSPTKTVLSQESETTIPGQETETKAPEEPIPEHVTEIQSPTEMVPDQETGTKEPHVTISEKESDVKESDETQTELPDKTTVLYESETKAPEVTISSEESSSEESVTKTAAEIIPTKETETSDEVISSEETPTTSSNDIIPVQHIGTIESEKTISPEETFTTEPQFVTESPESSTSSLLDEKEKATESPMSLVTKIQQIDSTTPQLEISSESNVIQTTSQPEKEILREDGKHTDKPKFEETEKPATDANYPVVEEQAPVTEKQSEDKPEINSVEQDVETEQPALISVPVDEPSLPSQESTKEPAGQKEPDDNISQTTELPADVLPESTSAEPAVSSVPPETINTVGIEASTEVSHEETTLGQDHTQLDLETHLPEYSTPEITEKPTSEIEQPSGPDTEEKVTDKPELHTEIPDVPKATELPDQMTTEQSYFTETQKIEPASETTQMPEKESFEDETTDKTITQGPYEAEGTTRTAEPTFSKDEQPTDTTKIDSEQQSKPHKEEQLPTESIPIDSTQSLIDNDNTPTEPTQTTKPELQFSETTPFLVELEEHTHKIDVEAPSSETPSEVSTISHEDDVTEKLPSSDLQTESPVIESETSSIQKDEISSEESTTPSTQYIGSEMTTESTHLTQKPISEISPETSEPSKPIDQVGPEEDKASTPKQVLPEEELTTLMPSTEAEKSPVEMPEKEVTSPKPQSVPVETTAPEEEFIPVTVKATTTKSEEEASTQSPQFDKTTKLEEKPSEISTTTPALDIAKPDELQPTDEIPVPEDESHFPPSGGYNQEPDYGDEDQAFGPGTCRYGGKVYVSAQQIPRDDPCDFCFCFRSDIICLQQSCPPPIHGCHEEPIQGFCCPRYECPVSMATTLNVTTTTTTTTTTLPPHFLPHAYKGAAQRRGCQIKGHTYKVGEVVRASSGPCLHCTCGGDGQMKCDPKACTPEPMLRQMIAAAVSSKRRR